MFVAGSIYSVESYKVTIVREFSIDEAEILEFLLVNVCEDILVSWRKLRFFSGKICVEVPYICFWTLRNEKNKKKTNKKHVIRHSPRTEITMATKGVTILRLSQSVCILQSLKFTWRNSFKGNKDNARLFVILLLCCPNGKCAVSSCCFAENRLI